jgi:hypothetical protein
MSRTELIDRLGKSTSRWENLFAVRVVWVCRRVSSIAEIEPIIKLIFLLLLFFIGTVGLYYLMFGSFKMTKPASKNH